MADTPGAHLNLAVLHTAAPLQEPFSRTLAENLSLLIPTDRVVLSPWPRTTVTAMSRAREALSREITATLLLLVQQASTR